MSSLVSTLSDWQGQGVGLENWRRGRLCFTLYIVLRALALTLWSVGKLGWREQRKFPIMRAGV